MKKGYYIHFQGRTSIGVSKKIDMQMEEFRKFYDMREIEVETPARSLAERVIGLLPVCSVRKNYEQALALIENPAFLYVRRTVADRAYVGFLRQVKQRFPDCKIIIEIFTYPYDKDEFGKWNAWPFYLKELMYRRLLKRYVDRFVTYSKDDCIFGIPTIRTSNGINVESVRMVQGEYRENELTMIGVAYMQRQHGYERVIEGLYRYYQNWDGKYRVYLYLVGDGPEKSKYEQLAEKYQLHEYVAFYPTTMGEALDRLYDEAEIALNAFGWYKAGCYDAISTLKIRESFAKGMPMISASPLDIVDEKHKYALMFPNDESPVEIDKVIEYYENLKKENHSKSDLALELRNFAKERAGMEVVMKPVIDFIEKKKLYLITKEYPIGNKETAFIDPEYKMLSEVYDISIVITELQKSQNPNHDGSCNVPDWKPDFCRKTVCAVKFLFHRDAWIEIGAIFRERKNIIRNLLRALMYGIYAESFFIGLRQSVGLSANTDAAFYFYWWDYKCLGLTMHKKRFPNIKIITRTHGYDLYDERETYGRQYFKPQMDRELERVIFVAHYGKQYYLDKYKKSDGVKYPVHCLGVHDPKVNLNIGRNEVFHIVSCSNVIPLKRIELIVEGLSKISDIGIKWVHMGDGSELDRLKDMAAEKLGKNIDYDFMGRVPNREVIKYYRENNVSCFITTTSTEGNPVSVQEALSFGFPVIATAVSDIPRMIDHNGILLSENPTGDEVAAAIRRLATLNHDDFLDLRRNSYRIYCRDYDAEVNYHRLIEDLAQVI